MTDISLFSGEGLRIENGRGLLLAVRSGVVWLTQEADRRDFFLDEGRWKRLDNDGLSIAYAFRPATLSVAAAPEGGLPAKVRVVTQGRNASRGYARRLGRAALAAWLRMHRAGAAIGRRLARARLERSRLFRAAMRRGMGTATPNSKRGSEAFARRFSKARAKAIRWLTQPDVH